MSLLAELMQTCKCEVHVAINEHRNYYESVEEYIENRYEKLAAPDVLREMIARDTVVAVQAYPQTPIGFVVCVHWDLDTALADALDGVRNY